jgi:hypothetical protein
MGIVAGINFASVQAEADFASDCNRITMWRDNRKVLALRNCLCSRDIQIHSDYRDRAANLLTIYPNPKPI